MDFRAKKVIVVEKEPFDENSFFEGKPIFNPSGAHEILKPVEPQGGLVPTWSISRLFKFEDCPHQIYLSSVKKLKADSGDAANRGQLIHDMAEKYVTEAEGRLPTELKKFEGAFGNLKDLFDEGKVTCEEDWAFTIDWEATGWFDKDCWLRMKLDSFIREDKTSAIIVDFKTGKKFGNEIKHGQQGLSYAIGAFMKFPDLEFVKTEFWYLDKGETATNSYTRTQAMVLEPRLKKRGIALTSCTDFPPKPSTHTCRWCPYKKSEECEWAER